MDRVTFRRVQRHAGTALAVLCPRRLQIMDVVECRRCDHCRGLSLDAAGRDVFLRCTWERSHAPDPLSSGALQDTVETIMSAPPTCITEDADLVAAHSLLVEREIGAVPVVDARGRAIGIVTRSDVLRWQHEHRDAAADAANGAIAIESSRVAVPSVRQVMSHVVFELYAGADIGRAAALMAHEGVHHVVVTSAEGKALGIVSALDVMGWLARICRYLVTK